jgi:thermopsin
MGPSRVQGSGPSVPSLRHADPYTYTLSPDYYEYFPFYALDGAEVTFSVTASSTIEVYVMTSAQYQQYQSYGSVSTIYSSSGTFVSSTVTLPETGQYYLLTVNQGSTATVTTSYSLYPSVPSYLAGPHSTPAPLGIADYGVVNNNGNFEPTVLQTNEVEGSVSISSISAYNSSSVYLTDGAPNYGAGLQLNVMMQVNTTQGQFVYWLQDVAEFDTLAQTVTMDDNVWNASAINANMSSTAVSGEGNVASSACSGCATQYYYGYANPSSPYTLPLSRVMSISVSYNGAGAQVTFGYSLGGAETVDYDMVTIADRGITDAAIIVNGYNEAPDGNQYYDAELVFAGYCCGLDTTFSQLSANLNIEYLSTGSSFVEPETLWTYGSDTGEGTYNLATTYSQEQSNVSVGTPNFYSSFLPILPLEVTKFTSPAVITDSELPFKYAFSINVAGGTAPYTYTTYFEGKSVSNYTTSNPFYSEALSSGGLGTGRYTYNVVVTDSSGREVTSSSGSIVVNSDPTVATEGEPVTDIGQNPSLSYSARLGTTPYTISWLVNGTNEGPSTPAGLRAGTYLIQVELNDSAGYQVESSPITIHINADPTISLSGRAFMDQGQSSNINYTASLGSPPYSISWVINGTNYPSIPALAPGFYEVEAYLTDSLNYTVGSNAFGVTVNPILVVNSSSSEPFSFVYTNNEATVTVSTSGGSPPYSFEWILNGVLVGNTTSPSFTYKLTTMGPNTIEAKVVDAAGYVTQSELTINFGYNYLTIGSVVVVVAVIVALVAFYIRRR